MIVCDACGKEAISTRFAVKFGSVDLAEGETIISPHLCARCRDAFKRKITKAFEALSVRERTTQDSNDV